MSEPNDDRPTYGAAQFSYRPAPAPADRAVDGFAVASLVLGILWVYWIGSILAVIFGHLALREIRRSGRPGHGLAIAGLVLGYIGIGVLAIVLVVVAIALGRGGSPQPIQ